MLRIILISLLITIGFSNCSSIRYSSYNRPFDFIKLHNNNWKSESSSIQDSTNPSIVTLQAIQAPENPIIATFQTTNSTAVPEIKTHDSLVGSDNPFSYQKQFPRSKINLKNSIKNTAQHTSKKSRKKNPKDKSNNWTNFFLIMGILIVALIALALLASYLSTTSVGQIILIVVILVFLVAGAIVAIAYDNYIFFDLLELLLFFL